MQERLLDFRKKAEHFVEKIATRILDIPPTYEIAAANFTHSKNCSRSKPLGRIEIEEYLNFHGAGGWGVETSFIPVAQKYVVCPECHHQQKYSG